MWVPSPAHGIVRNMRLVFNVSQIWIERLLKFCKRNASQISNVLGQWVEQSRPIADDWSISKLLTFRFWEIINTNTSEANVILRFNLTVYVWNKIFQDLPRICNSISLSASLQWVHLQHLETVPIVVTIDATYFSEKRPLNSFQLLNWSCVNWTS